MPPSLPSSLPANEESAWARAVPPASSSAITRWEGKTQKRREGGAKPGERRPVGVQASTSPKGAVPAPCSLRESYGQGRGLPVPDLSPCSLHAQPTLQKTGGKGAVPPECPLATLLLVPCPFQGELPWNQPALLGLELPLMRKEHEVHSLETGQREYLLALCGAGEPRHLISARLSGCKPR